MTWTMQLFNKDGGYITDIVEATSRSLQFNLNGIDQLTFNIPLDAAEAFSTDSTKGIHMLTRYVKVWRTVNDPANGISYADPPQQPCFAGVVAGITKAGAANQMSVTVYSPFWRLQFRFARTTLKIPSPFYPAPMNAPMNTSNYLWSLIHITNSLAGDVGGGRTGIVGPDVAAWNGEFAAIDPIRDPAVSGPWKYMRGTSLWDEIQAKINAQTQADGTSTAETLELEPVYVHNAGFQRLMFFNTTNHLGALPNVPTATFDYHMGSHNCDDFQTTETADPSQFANYLVLSGSGDMNSPILVYPKLTDTNAWNRIATYGIYEKWLQNSKWDSRFRMRAQAAATIARKGMPTVTYSPTVNPAMPPYYGTGAPHGFVLGDNVRVGADKGALQVPDPELAGLGFEITSGAYAIRRAYTVQLDLDEFGFERVTPTLAPDWSTSSAMFF